MLFPMLTEGLFRFLKDLENDNTKEWMHANKERYEAEVREPCRAFVREVAPGLRRLGAEADDARSGGSLAPQHRDRRFDRDQAPYWTHVLLRFPLAGAGPRRLRPAFTLRLNRDGAHVGAGLRDPGAKLRAQVRDHIVERRGAWTRLRRRIDLEAGRPLQRVPRGLEDHPWAEDLRRRDLTASLRFPREEVASERFPRDFVAACQRLAPLPRFLAEALIEPAAR